MATHSKGSYVAFRSGRNAPTRKELARRKYLSEEMEKFCDAPFPHDQVIDDINKSVLLPNGAYLHRMGLP
jgi:hypothetical protein